MSSLFFFFRWNIRNILECCLLQMCITIGNPVFAAYMEGRAENWQIIWIQGFWWFLRKIKNSDYDTTRLGHKVPITADDILKYLFFI